MSMAFPENTVFSDSDMLRFLINLIGDMHMPLHWGFGADGRGERIKINTFTGKT